MPNGSANQSEAERPAGSIVPGSSVRLSGEHARVRVPNQKSAEEPRVEVIRAGEVVQAIDVHCTCGRHIRVRCLYD